MKHADCMKHSQLVCRLFLLSGHTQQALVVLHLMLILIFAHVLAAVKQ